jgi:ketosteroid isomerase-like protein
VFAGGTSSKVKRTDAENDMFVVEWHGETPLARGSVYTNEYSSLIRVQQGPLAEVTRYFDTVTVNA